MSASFALSQITKITFSTYLTELFFHKETHFTQNRPPVHGAGHFALPDGLSNLVFRHRKRPCRGLNVQICDLSHSPCRLIVGDRPLIVSIDGLPIRPEHDFVLRLQGCAGHYAGQGLARGKEMFMGLIPCCLKPSDGVAKEVTQVGSCTAEAMDWLMTIEWSNGQRHQLTLGAAR
jgi:hypothetical protein